jgi:hypothetical protein
MLSSETYLLVLDRRWKLPALSPSCRDRPVWSFWMNLPTSSCSRPDARCQYDRLRSFMSSIRGSSPLKFRNVSFVGIPWIAILLIVGAVVLGVIMSRSVFGRDLLAVAQSERAACLVGIPIRWLTTIVYVSSAVRAAVTGLLLATFSEGATLGISSDFLLMLVALVVIGGTNITGGRVSAAPPLKSDPKTQWRIGHDRRISDAGGLLTRHMPYFKHAGARGSPSSNLMKNVASWNASSARRASTIRPSSLSTSRAGTDGKLTYINKQVSGGGIATHSGVDRNGKFAFAVNYAHEPWEGYGPDVPGRAVAVCLIRADGGRDPAISMVARFPSVKPRHSRIAPLRARIVGLLS